MVKNDGRGRLALTAIALLAVLTVSGALAWLYASRLGLMPLLPGGELRSGKAFGIEVGQDHSLARQTLLGSGKREFVDEGYGQSCRARQFAQDELVSVYLERSWKITVICVVSRNAKVTSIMWTHSIIGSP